MFVALKAVFAVFMLNVLLFVLYYCISIRMLAKQMVQTAEHLNDQLVFGHRMNRSIETSFFVYRAYVEQSFNQINVRVLTINHCLDLNSAYEGSIDGQRISLKPQPVEDSCPWQWAPGCLYNSYVLDGQANIVKYNSPYITLYRGKKKITIPLQRIPYRTKGAMAICVPPLYWYTNWAKMIFALELWKAQGVIHVIIYHHSSTKHVYKVLTHYQKEIQYMRLYGICYEPRKHVYMPFKIVLPALSYEQKCACGWRRGVSKQYWLFTSRNNSARKHFYKHQGSLLAKKCAMLKEHEC